jgi:hypothetical protein
MRKSSWGKRKKITSKASYARVREDVGVVELGDPDVPGIEDGDITVDLLKIQSTGARLCVFYDGGHDGQERRKMLV